MSTRSATSSKLEAGHVTIYVAEQRASFVTQQSMLISEVYHQRTLQQTQSQVLDYLYRL